MSETMEGVRRTYEMHVSLDGQTDATLKIVGHLTKENADTLFEFLAVARGVMNRWPDKNATTLPEKSE